MIIDTHVHMTDGRFRKGDDKGLSSGETIDLMDACDIEKIWISPTSGLYGAGEYEVSNYELFKFCSYSPKRFIGFCTVNPNYGSTTIDEIRRCVYDYGFKGLKLHTWLQGCPVSHESVSLITEECIDLDIPMIFHDGTAPYASTLQVVNLASRYPQARIILGHAGLIESCNEAIHAANKYPNVYLSLTGPSIFYLQKIIDETDKTKIMFGSDFGFGKSSFPLKNRLDMFRFVEMSEDTRDKLFYVNADNFLS